MRIFLSGPMGSGKSSVARAVGEALGLPVLDLDALIEARAGRDIPSIFRERGEPGFREFERDTLAALLDDAAPAVVALGGGSVTDAALRRRLLRLGTLVTLEASVSTLANRVGQGAGRPLLAGQDVEAALTSVIEERAPAYAECHATLRTDVRTLEEAARAVVDVVREAPIVVPLGLATYRVEVGSGTRERLASRVDAMCKSPAVGLVSDPNIARWADEAEALLSGAGRRVVRMTLEPGEEHKTLATVDRLWNAALDAELDRGSGVVAVAGGVGGDLTGFMAATLFRGIAVGHVPTTLLAMVDSAIGGKTGFDTPHGKNLIGAFHQPSFVLCDVDVLSTLPERERRAGLAEVAKSAWIAGEEAVAALERDSAELARGEPEATARAIRMSAAMKAGVVTEDEREAGRRAVLNLGHTVGHAIEAAQGYQGMRHGEAVALGLVAAFRLATARDGGGSAEHGRRMERLLSSLGLETDVAPHLNERTLAYMRSDKKRRSDKVTFVVPGAPGELALQPIALEELIAALRAG